MAGPVKVPRRAHAAAPVRLDFAGGWTDVRPFSTREGGAVVAAAISLRAHVNVLPGGGSVHLIADDLGLHAELPADGGRGAGVLPLLEAGVRLLPVGSCTVVTRSDAPNGSGLGTSGALGVAIVTALGHARGEEFAPVEAAELAWRLEAVEAGNAGGKQDQYMAALGGFQSLAFRDPAVVAEPIAIDAAFADALARDIVLCYTGVSRVSGRMISRVMGAYAAGDAGVASALRGIRDAAAGMREALAEANERQVAALLDENWRWQQALDHGMRTAAMGRLESAARAAGALGGKAAGAGAGGSMFFYAPGAADAVATAARDAGAQVLPFSWAWEGVQRW